jgi:hypothetical protein
MSLATDPGSLVNAGSGALLLALGLWVATVRPRRRTTLLFAAFSSLFGALFVTLNLLTVDDPAQNALAIVDVGLAIAAGVTLVALAHRFPIRLVAAERLPQATAALLAGVSLAVQVLLVFVEGVEQYGAAAGVAPSARLAWFENTIALDIFTSCEVYVLALWGLRFSRAEPRGAERRAYVTMSAALVLFVAYGAGVSFASASLADRLGTFATLTAVLVVIAACWLRNARWSARPDSARARDVALLTLAAVVAGMASVPAYGSFAAVVINAPTFGVTRLLGVGILAYAILRHQLLGLDVRVKWTIRRGTLAAVFIVVFLVISQVAQNYLQQYGVLAGGVAAGVLLFALTPLQRFAERVADTAMPGVKPAGEMTGDERRRAYREAARIAWEDGTLSRDERAMLRGLQRAFGLTDADAQRIEREVEGAAA